MPTAARPISWIVFAASSFVFALLLGAAIRAMRPAPNCEPEDVSAGVPVAIPAIQVNTPGLLLIGGRVRDAADQAISGALVELSTPRWRVRSGADGRFVFPPVPRESAAWITAIAEGYRASSTAVEPDRARALEVELSRDGWIGGRIQGIDGRPRAAATVTLVGSGVWPARTTSSDHSGHFQFSAVPDGVYEVRVRADREVALPRRGLELSAGARAFLSFHLEPGIAMRGALIDALTEAPISDAQVTVMPESLGLAPRRARSERDGSFGLVGLLPAAHQVSVRAAGYVPVVARSWEPGAALRIAMEPGATLLGRVIDRDGRPVADARIDLVSDPAGATTRRAPADPAAGLGVTATVPALPLAPSERAPEWVSESELPATFSETDGTFRIADLPSGYLELVASAAGYSPTHSTRLFLRAGAQIGGVELVLGDAGELRGQVLNADGQPKAETWIELRSADLPWPQLVATDEDGRFRCHDLAGTVDVRVVGESGVSRRVEVLEGERTEIVLAIAASEPALKGRVQGGNGEPIGGARVRLASMAPGCADRRETVSDDWGEFAFDRPPPGPWKLEAEHPEFALSPAREVERAGEPVELRLVPAMTLLGSVFANEGELEEVEVSLSRASGAPLAFDAQPDETGAFEIHQVPPGSYRLRVIAPGYQTEVRTVRLDARRAVTANTSPVRMIRAHLVEGEVVDSLGRPVAGAVVRIDAGDDPVSTDHRGHFALPGVPTGRFEVEALHPIAGAGTRSVRVLATRDPLPVLIRLPERLDREPANQADALRQGVACVVAQDAERVVIVSVESRRAQRVGLEPGDQVLSVDGTPVESAADAEALLRGDPGLSAVLELERDQARFRVRVPRERW